MRRTLSKIMKLGVFLVLVLALAYLIMNVIMVKAVVVGDSMEPVLSDGDVIMCNKLTYSFNPPERMDIAVVPAKDGTAIVKRVMATPGDTIQINNFGKVEVNGKVLENDPGIGIIMDKGCIKDPLKMDTEEFFVMGDNRNSSKDSRHDEVGTIKRSQFIGRAAFRIYPMDKIGPIE